MEACARSRSARQTTNKQRKRRKPDPNTVAQPIKELEREVAEIRSQLEAPASVAVEQSRQLALECLEMKQRTAFLNKKLADHSHWMQRVSSLMESAPLLEIACALASEGGDGRASSDAHFGADYPRGPHTQPGLTLSFVDQWRRGSSSEPLSRFALKERLKAVVDRSSAHASSLVDNYDPASTLPRVFPLQMESRGWRLATGTMVDDNVAFRCERALPPPSIARANDIANELWSSLAQDEVQRTFIPVVQESVLAYQQEDCSLWYHVLQLCTSDKACPVATVGSFQPLGNHQDGKTDGWQIAMESVHDNYLHTFAGDAAGTRDSDLRTGSVSPPAGSASPLAALNLGLSIHKFSLLNNFVIGIRVTATDAGVELLFVGSGVFELQHIRDPALELLQYLVTCLPIYEELYLQQYAGP